MQIKKMKLGLALLTFPTKPPMLGRIYSRNTLHVTVNFSSNRVQDMVCSRHCEIKKLFIFWVSYPVDKCGSEDFMYLK